MKRKYLTTGVIFLGLIFSLQNAGYAALCAFRNPDRDTYKLFPEATGYRSVVKILDPEAKKDIEEFLGQPLDYDETGEITFYLVLKGEEVIGVIRPHAERGKYGIVEMVWAFTLDGRIIDFMLQRCRERGSQMVKKDEFRRQFKDKSLEDPLTLDASKKINDALLVSAQGAEKLSSIVAYSGKKNLFLLRHFFPELASQKPPDGLGKQAREGTEKPNAKEKLK
jgi:hypothetical protein